jgi:glucosyl-3-phosphoglycerate synthase
MAVTVPDDPAHPQPPVGLGHRMFLTYLDSFATYWPVSLPWMSIFSRQPHSSGLGARDRMLAEVYRNVATQRICQVDLAANYEHKHQELPEDDPSKES